MSSTNYLDELNPVQRKAVEHIEGPLMVIAGAGSGKTRVLTYRIAHLIHKGIDPYNILALTFTNKAAREMKERISRIVGPSDAKALWMGTFHSVFARILRNEADRIGYPKNFTIYDTADSRSLLKNIITKELKLDDKVYKVSIVHNRISAAKNNLLTAADYANQSILLQEDASAKRPQLSEIYRRYEKRCFNSGAMDFDDLLFKTNVLLKNSPEALLKYQEKFKYIMVDEFQDTNFAQAIILKRLAARYENICVVGDDTQSIYAFRGANIQNILNFKRDYQDTATYKLEQNYRSTQTIVGAANSIIAKNKEQLDKNVWTQNATGDSIQLIRARSDNEEGRAIADEIYRTRSEEQAANSDFAILYRTNAQSRAMEEALRKLNIPYRIYGGLSFYQRKEIKDILAYFRLLVNHKDEEALRRVINYPKRGLGQTTIDRITVFSSEQGVSIWDGILQLLANPRGLNSGTITKLSEFINMIRSFEGTLETENAYELASKMAASSGILRELYQDKTIEGVSRYENIQELLAGIKEFTDSAPEGEVRYLADFMQDVALLTDQDKDDKNDSDRVGLMTVHSAKGLEFPYVFIVGLEENLFPSQMSTGTRSELEEERRLFYVALTRAEKKAYLSYALTRYKWGNLIYCEPSRFLEEIDSSFISTPPSKESFSPSGSDSRQVKRLTKTPTRATPSINPAPNRKLVRMSESGSRPNLGRAQGPSDLSPGMEVEHQRFGKGKVIRVEGNPESRKATINFEGKGEKQLLLKFAQLTVLKSS